MGNKTFAFLVVMAIFMCGIGVGVYLGSNVIAPTVGQCINSFIGQ